MIQVCLEKHIKLLYDIYNTIPSTQQQTMPRKLCPISVVWYNTLLYGFISEKCLGNCAKLQLNGYLDFSALILVVCSTINIV